MDQTSPSQITKNPASTPEKTQKQERLADALRRNLQRRKAAPRGQPGKP